MKGVGILFLFVVVLYSLYLFYLQTNTILTNVLGLVSLFGLVAMLIPYRTEKDIKNIQKKEEHMQAVNMVQMPKNEEVKK